MKSEIARNEKILNLEGLIFDDSVCCQKWWVCCVEREISRERERESNKHATAEWKREKERVR